MIEKQISLSTTGSLASLMGLGTQTSPDWTEQELEAMFEHQWSAPLAFDLCALQGVDADHVQTLSQDRSPRIKTFGDLLTHADPPIELLRLVKEFAKAGEDQDDSPIPGPIASALYYASLAAARTRTDDRLTTLSDTALRRGLEWTHGQPWIHGELRELIDRALDRFDG